MYAVDGKMGSTPCRKVNDLKVRASLGISISTQLAEVSVTFNGSTRMCKHSLLRKKIYDHKTLRHTKTGIETAKKNVLLN